MDRKQEILQAIINEFIETAQPVGSQTILISCKLHVSPATIRNDMAALEKEGLLYQPHTSAGRVPTDSGYRLFVEEMADYEKARKKAVQVLNKVRESYAAEKVKNHIYDAVELLARATSSVSFATLPDNNRTFYLGLSNALKQPEFQHGSVNASQVIEVLERHDRFVSLLKDLEIDDTVKTFIGKENILEQIQSCSLMVSTYNLQGYHGFFGLLGPTRMNYAFNRAILEEVRQLIHNQ